MSVYNGERWLSDSIRSVIDQTFSDFEFIIVNDGSKDRSHEILEEYSSLDSRICILDKDNTGLADSLNFGIAHARGKWIARIDADDISEPQRLEKQYDVAQSDARLVLVGTGLVIIDDCGQKYKKYVYPTKNEMLVRRLTRYGAFFPHSSAFFRKAALQQQIPYRTRIRRSQDRDLWLRLSEVGKIACINEPLVHIRKHSEQVSHEDLGYRQLVDSHVAMVSYWLRHFGAQDPVDSYSDQQFQLFRDWVYSCMQENSSFEIFQFVGSVKAYISESHKITSSVGSLAGEILNAPDIFYRWASSKIFGSGLPKKLAQQWMIHT